MDEGCGECCVEQSSSSSLPFSPLTVKKRDDIFPVRFSSVKTGFLTKMISDFFIVLQTKIGFYNLWGLEGVLL